MSLTAGSVEPRWFLTHHARVRGAERGITAEQAIATAMEPEIAYDQDNFGAGRQVRQRSDLAVVVDKETGAIITVLFRDKHRWAAECEPQDPHGDTCPRPSHPPAPRTSRDQGRGCAAPDLPLPPTPDHHCIHGLTAR